MHQKCSALLLLVLSYAASYVLQTSPRLAQYQLRSILCHFFIGLTDLHEGLAHAGFSSILRNMLLFLM